MTEKILIGVAWPYANGPLHLGHIAGCYLPADIFARFNRLKGNDVLMVSGSDMHGTPITVRADQEGVGPEVIAERYHKSFLESWEQLGITFDLFTKTRTPNHAEVTQDIFLTLLGKDYIYRDTMESFYCPVERRFLPDRYVEGTCPHCGHPNARGDQCNNCGRPLNPTELIGPRCKFCSTTPELRETEHFFLRLSAFNDRLLDWVKQKHHWKPNVISTTLSFLKEGGLHDRAITRDIQWGVTVPVEGFQEKRIYVWFDAVIGYLSAAKEYSQNTGQPDKWREFWENPEAKTYNFIGKDNIPFHTIIWPAMLMGYGGLNLPYDVPSNEFLTLESRPLSTSLNWAVWVPDYLERYDPDPLRYYLSANMPELGDSDFSWREFVRRNNDELVATYGNLVHRVLTFTYRNFDKQVPTPGEFDEKDLELLQKTREALDTVGGLLSRTKFRESVRTIMGLAQEANRYLDEKAPWKSIKTDRQACATSLYVALSAISGLGTLFNPFLPFSSEKIHKMLGFEGTVNESGWQYTKLPGGQILNEPEPLFSKLDDKIVDDEMGRLGTSS